MRKTVLVASVVSAATAAVVSALVTLRLRGDPVADELGATVYDLRQEVGGLRDLCAMRCVKP